MDPGRAALIARMEPDLRSRVGQRVRLAAGELRGTADTRRHTEAKLLRVRELSDEDPRADAGRAGRVRHSRSEPRLPLRTGRRRDPGRRPRLERRYSRDL